MKKLVIAIIFSFTTISAYAFTNLESLDTENPLFFERGGDVLSVSAVDFGNDILALHQKISVGVNDRLSINGQLNWQQDFSGPQDGFSYSGLGIAYRFSDLGLIADFLANIKFGGKARIPEYADTVYSVGVRVGKRWSRVTLAATLETNWIFDELYGMAYIDLTPEIYFRAASEWFVGANFMIRKATNPVFDAEWVGAKIVRQYGRTMYIGFTEYEIEESEVRFGAKLNILF